MSRFPAALRNTVQEGGIPPHTTNKEAVSKVGSLFFILGKSLCRGSLPDCGAQRSRRGSRPTPQKKEAVSKVGSLFFILSKSLCRGSLPHSVTQCRRVGSRPTPRKIKALRKNSSKPFCFSTPYIKPFCCSEFSYI